MDTYTQVFHTGKQWVEITYKPIINESGNFTGHYEELSRRQIIVFGIFDDKQTLQNATDNITIFRNTMRNNLYLLSGFKDETVIYRAYSHDADSLSNQVIQYLKDKHFVVINHQPFNPNKDDSTTIVFQGYIREQEGEKDCPFYTITLSCLDSKTTPVA